ncbi:hypothetical protein VTK26DRAFT_8323 [Humicola hyalothermophila]
MNKNSKIGKAIRLGDGLSSKHPTGDWGKSRLPQGSCLPSSDVTICERASLWNACCITQSILPILLARSERRACSTKTEKRRQRTKEKRNEKREKEKKDKLRGKKRVTRKDRRSPSQASLTPHQMPISPLLHPKPKPKKGRGC